MAGTKLSTAYAQLVAVAGDILTRLDEEAAERQCNGQPDVFVCAGYREDLRAALRAVESA